MGEYGIVNGNSLQAFIGVNAPTTNEMTKDDIRDYIRNTYPQMADLLICMAFKESTLNPGAIGDSGLAKGLWQIHIDKHPVTEWCAFDVECSTQWTVKQIKNGRGYLWTAYPYCQ